PSSPAVVTALRARANDADDTVRDAVSWALARQQSRRQPEQFPSALDRGDQVRLPGNATPWLS
ncbi:MAG: hypothetical protein H7A19_17905, partial [Rhodanobacteraceae bacterium]|nr:hypothetical protein [Rhodanobacteraceae bacterium]